MTAEVDTAATGLTSAEVSERVAAGLTNDVPDPHSRSLASIVRANTLTYFNFLIGSLWVLMLFSAPLIDGLFGLVIIVNTGIGILQEWRAARTLARLSVLGQARPVVRRDGVECDLAPRELVRDDLILLRQGDQLLVDGEVVVAAGLEVDESLLTGEADPVHKSVGDTGMSGSFVVAGSGSMRATKVGGQSYAAELAAQARQFATTRSELAGSVQRFIKIVSYVLFPLAVLLFISQYRANDGRIRDAIAGTVPGVITMVPEGLVLLTTIAMAVSVIRLARRRALVQEMPAVEVLARVDVVCVDKTGTLTAPGMELAEVVTLADDAPVAVALAALAAAEPDPNPTLAAVAAAYPGPGDWVVESRVPFSSGRKWSAATFDGHGSYLLGAPEMLLADTDPVRGQADARAAAGSRVLLLASSEDVPSAATGPGGLRPLALLVIEQRLRESAADTVRYFLDQGVTVKVISGDNPVTVGAIAAAVGVPGAKDAVDARTLPTDPEELAAVVAAANVFGRVSPDQKRAMVGALQRRGHTVAMTGDGVNDVLALKDADLGIAMGSGAGATRAVAQIVLLDDSFAVMPSVVAEGRRVLGNIERVADLFLTKSFYAMAVSITTVVLALPFPFLNRHLTLVTAFTIGIPSFFLALMPNTERFRPGFFRRVVVFAIPAGIICALTAYTSYGLALAAGNDTSIARASASYTLFVVAWWVLVQVARPWTPLRVLICLAMVVGFAGVVLVPFLNELFALGVGADRTAVLAVAVGAVGAVAVTVLRLFVARWREAPVPA
ncbi:MAG TPA: HAD-IC family P-type ATPase [Candidatus Nanopelagicales bacterium]|nr:HAD-IC family P-type ATPase [Candidatus Nanopelagicales bacterium]